MSWLVWIGDRTTKLTCDSLPLDTPQTPAFGREEFQHKIKELFPGVAYDDTYALNTQSGTQWDGFRHVCSINRLI